MVLNSTSQLTSLFILGLKRIFINYKLTPQELRQYQFRPNIGIKRLRVSTPSIPYRPAPVFMPTRTPTKGSRSYSYQLLLSGLIDTNPAPKGKAQWLFRLGICGLDFQDLFLYIVVLRTLIKVLRKVQEGFQEGPGSPRNNIPSID